MMSNRWNPAVAAGLTSALDLRAYSSRLLGADPALVMHGGGNTSIKQDWITPDGDTIPCLYVKGSGADLALVTAADFTPLALHPARALLDGPPLADDAFIEALAPLVLRPGAPRPSIETLLHAALPATHVEHTHSDNVLALVNTEASAAVVRKVYGKHAPLVPFRHSGFELARACADVFAREATRETIGLILAFHGAVAFGNDAKTSHDNMLLLAQLAETYLRARGAWDLPRAAAPSLDAGDGLALARLRLHWSGLAGFPLVLARSADAEVMGFVTRDDLPALALQGPPTPQHAIFTKRIPLLGRDASRYAADYRTYLADHAPTDTPAGRLPDPAPRIMLDERFGLVGAGIDAHHARITVEVYRHDIDIVSRASAHDHYRSLPPADVLAGEIHYGGFERRRRASAASDAPLLGAIVLVLGDVAPAAACAARLRAAGASVIERPGTDDFERTALDVALTFGGLDLIVAPVPIVPVPDLLRALFDLSPFDLAPGGSRVPDIARADAGVPLLYPGTTA